MIVVELCGGLGNQMFQYAVGYSLAQKRRCPIIVDCASYRTDPKRKYELSAFPFHVRKLGRLHFSIPSVFVERGFSFDPDVLRLEDPVTLRGYFQAEAYFDGVATAIRERFSKVRRPSRKFFEWKSRIQAYPSVALQVRRGDYQSSSETRAVHGLLSAQYFSEGLQCVLSRRKVERIFLFSDSTLSREEIRSICPSNLPVEVVPAEGLSSAESLLLMSAADSNVISNSSFGWWAAWLNPNPEKCVVVPNRWFGPSGPRDTQSIYCSFHTRVNNDFS
jgi:hypothetical protein